MQISKKSIRFIDGFLAKDIEQMQCDFALRWFKDNKKKIIEQGITIPQDASNDWKINLVLSSKVKGGMGADVRKSNYKQINSKINKLMELRNNLKKEIISPETPLLILNYLQANNRNLKQSYVARKELASKILGKNIVGEVEKLIKIQDAKNKWIVREMRFANKEAQDQHSTELLNREWEYYWRLTKKQKEKYKNEFGRRKVNTPLEISFADFNAIPKKSSFYAPKEVYKKYTECNRGMFYMAMSEFMAKNRIKEPVFYSMLIRGVKPYEISAKADDYFIRKMTEDYVKRIDLITREKLEDRWEQECLKRIKAGVEKYINELARSFVKAARIIMEIYGEAREKIITECINNLLKDGISNTKQNKSKFLKEKKFISSLKISPSQGRFLLYELPLLSKKQHLKLSRALKDVYLLNQEEKQIIKKIKNNWK